MNEKDYKRYQKFKGSLFNFVDDEIGVETIAGNEVFQRMADAAFEVFQKYPKEQDHEDN